MNIIPTKPIFLKSLAPYALLGMVCVATSGLRAQESLAGVGVASGMSASLSGMSSSGAIAAGSNARRSVDGLRAGSSSDLTESSELFGSGGGSSGEGALGPNGIPAVAEPPKPRIYGIRHGSAFLNELLAGYRAKPQIPSPVGRIRSPGRQATLAKNIRGMTDAQRKQLVLKKYDIRPKNWLAHYVIEDRYKIASGLWNFMTTRTSRFYYRPWSAAMLKADPNHVIGFRTWHDAMMAGYRPDPVSRPEPAAQLVQLASYTKGEGMLRYIDFVYAGQVSPNVFDRNYNYINQVASILKSHKHTRPLVGETIEKVLLASMGEGTVPTSVGGPPPVRPSLINGNNGDMSTGSSSSSSSSSSGSSSSGSGMAALQAGNTDRRTDDFNNFSSRAGSLANVPANSGSGSGSSGPPTN